MAALNREPQHIGDATVVCPACGQTIAVPVTCALVVLDRRTGRAVMRCTPDVSPLAEHVAQNHRAVTPGHTMTTDH